MYTARPPDPFPKKTHESKPRPFSVLFFCVSCLLACKAACLLVCLSLIHPILTSKKPMFWGSVPYQTDTGTCCKHSTLEEGAVVVHYFFTSSSVSIAISLLQLAGYVTSHSHPHQNKATARAPTDCEKNKGYGSRGR